MMAVPGVGALVTVQFSGEVRDSSDDRRGGFWLTLPYDALLRSPVTSSWVPPTATVQVVRPARPREVLLLACGHLSQKKRPASPSEEVFCVPCMRRQPLEAIGSLSW